MPETVRAKRFRIICSYQNREWNQIQASLKQREILQYIISETKNLENSFLNYHPLTSQEKTVKARTFYPPPETAEILKRLSETLGMEPSTIVARLLLTPLLKK